jgi:hypothetical protein
MHSIGISISLLFWISEIILVNLTHLIQQERSHARSGSADVSRLEYT